MISYIKGTLEFSSDQYMILEAGGIGYHISASPLVLAALPPKGSIVKIYTFMSVKEDDISLFGFQSMEELDIFNHLIAINGVGPKAGLGFLATLSPNEIVMAILTDDVQTLSKAPGIGKKIAQRVILELKDKFKSNDLLDKMTQVLENDDTNGISGTGAKFEAISALTALGYSRSEAAKAVSEVFEEGSSTEELLKKALKKMI